MSLALASRCPICKSSEGLSKCGGCHVMPYCGREHQISHRDDHKQICNLIKKNSKNLEKAEQELRSKPPGFMLPPNVFEEKAGNFWGILDTRPYMRARFAVLDSLLKIKTLHAVQAAYDNAIECLRLSRSDNLGVRGLVPAIQLRLGRDQECYDFMKWYETTGQRGDYDWGNISLPYLDVVDADVFEPVDFFCNRFGELSFTVSATLLKVRLLLDTKSLQNSGTIGQKIPKELLDDIRTNLVSTIIARRKEIMEADDQTLLIKTLESQISILYAGAKKQNEFFWPALIRPEGMLGSPPGAYSPGDENHAKLTLRHTYDSWAETPGAIDIIRELVKKDRT